jgi:adenine-specific DNA-methyltransferase
MSRLTDLLRQAKQRDPQLGGDLEAEIKVLSGRRAFGLNFERHRPEAVELPQRPVRKGDKVHVLLERGSTKKGDQRLWRVSRLEEVDGVRVAHLSVIGAAEPETQVVSVEDLAVVAEFRDPIYPSLVSTGKVERGGDSPFHTVINGENFHVLEALTYTHKGKIDAIYIDPPYNTGAPDWKYNNDYVDGEDLYRHSKWLAFMERRLLLANQLLNPRDSVLVVTIDEKEYLRLGMLLEQTFPDASLQMVTSVIAPSGQPRANQMSRVEEYVYVVYFGTARVGQELQISAEAPEGETETRAAPIQWENLIRRGTSARRVDRENQFYPFFIDPVSKRIVGIGEPLLPTTAERQAITTPPGQDVVWPIRSDGTEGRWRISRSAALKLAERGLIRLGRKNRTTGRWAINYVLRSDLARIEAGEIEVIGRADDGSAVLQRVGTAPSIIGGIPKTVWIKDSHNAGNYGSALLREFIPGRSFPFPKSLYAVEDTLRLFVKNKSEATILDFFSGSGTTAHAVMRLNRQDGGRRQCISVTNNEVSEDEQKRLRKEGLRPGDPGWEKWGICEYITKPRIEAAITGKTPGEDAVKGKYKFTDEFPMSDGFEENAEFFTLTYETPLSVGHNQAFERIAPLLWLRVRSRGRRIDAIPAQGWDVAEAYGILFDLDQATPFCTAVDKARDLGVAFIVTDDDRRYQSVVRRLPSHVEPVRLYETYLSNFRINLGE